MAAFQCTCIPASRRRRKRCSKSPAYAHAPTTTSCLIHTGTSRPVCRDLNRPPARRVCDADRGGSPRGGLWREGGFRGRLPAATLHLSAQAGVHAHTGLFPNRNQDEPADFSEDKSFVFNMLCTSSRNWRKCRSLRDSLAKRGVRWLGKKARKKHGTCRAGPKRALRNDISCLNLFYNYFSSAVTIFFVGRG